MANGDLDAALACFRGGQLPEAARRLGEILRQEPENFEALNYAGMVEFKLGRHAEALDILGQALALNSDSPGVLANMGLVQHAQGDIAAAQAAFDKALALDSENDLIRDTVANVKKQPVTSAAGALQGSHVPERQVFMAATVDLLSDRPPPLRILEIGSYMGISVLTWAHAVDALYGGPGTITCVDPWGDHGVEEYAEDIQAALNSDIAYQVFLHNIATAPECVEIDHIRGTSSEILPTLEAASFDIAYIDGCHYFEDVRHDIQAADRILRHGGIMCGDDLELQASECDMTAAAANRETGYMADPVSAVEYHPGVTLAVDDFFGAVSAYAGFWCMRKTQAGYEKVSFRQATGRLPHHWPADFVEAAARYVEASDEIGGVKE